MSTVFEDNLVEKFSAECSLTYSSFIYCMMMNRLSRGYSAQELSFLLGQEDDFVENLERFKRFEFGVELYQHLCKVFGHPSFLHQQHCAEKKMQHEMHTWKAGETIFYRMECCKSEFESIVLFQLTEEDPDTRVHRYKNSVEFDCQQSQRALKVMLENDVFIKPIGGHELHQLVEYAVESHVHPIYVKTELEKLVGRKGKAPLKRTKRRSYAYRYVLHPGVDLADAIDFVNQKFEKL